MVLNHPDQSHLGPPPTPCPQAQTLPEHCCRYSSISWMDPSYIHHSSSLALVPSWSAALTLALVPRWVWSHTGASSPVPSLVPPPERALCLDPGPGSSLCHVWGQLCLLHSGSPSQHSLSSQLACLEGAALLLLLPDGDTSGPWLSGYSRLIAQAGFSWCLISVSLMLPGSQRRISSSNSCLMPLASYIRKIIYSYFHCSQFSIILSVIPDATSAFPCLHSIHGRHPSLQK